MYLHEREETQGALLALYMWRKMNEDQRILDNADIAPLLQAANDVRTKYRLLRNILRDEASNWTFEDDTV